VHLGPTIIPFQYIPPLLYRIVSFPLSLGSVPSFYVRNVHATSLLLKSYQFWHDDLRDQQTNVRGRLQGRIQEF